MNGFIGEFLGTMILIVLGVGTGAGINLKTSYARNAGWLFVTLAWGMAVTFGVYVAGSFGAQGHLNPAVTIGFALFGFFPWSAASMARSYSTGSTTSTPSKRCAGKRCTA